RQRSYSDTGAQTELSATIEDRATHQRSHSDAAAQTDPAATRTENSDHRRAQSGSSTRSDRPSQRESDLERALQRAREAYRNLQQDADRLSRQLHVTIDQIAPLNTQIRRLETQVQRLSEQLGNPLIRTSAGTQTQPAPILERIHDRLSRIDEHLRELEGPRLVPAEPTPSSERVDALEQERNQLDTRLREVKNQLGVLRERNLELSTQLSTLTSPSPNLPRLTNEQFRILLSLAQQLGLPSVRDSEDFPFGTDTQFLDLPQEIRDSVYFQMYSICYPTRVPDTWRCGEKFFLNQEGLHGNNGLRSLAITRYLHQSLANEFATLGNGQASSPDVMARFDLLPEEDQIGILRQYQFLHRKSEEPLETTRESFLGLNDITATNEERNEAISRYLQVQISERYGKMISELTEELLRLSEQLDTTQDSYEEALDHLRLEMVQLREQSRLDLASAMFHASSIQSELDTARDQIAQLTGDLIAKDLQIAALHQQAAEAVEQQRRAQEQIDELIRIGGGKEIDIAQLRINIRQAVERERRALDEIARLKLEGDTKDSRIADLDRQVSEAANKQRIAQSQIDRLTRESSGKDSRIADLQRDALAAAEQRRLDRLEIDRLTLEVGTKNSRISALEQDIRDGAERERLARLEIDSLKLDGGAKDLRISTLEQDIRDGAERERLARLEIDSLKLDGGAKDLRISTLEQDIRDGAERERLARLEIDSLKLEVGTKNSRISALEQNIRDGAERERLAHLEIDSLKQDAGGKDLRISALEKDIRDGAERERLARLEIDKLTREGGTKDSRIADLDRQVRESANKQRIAEAEINRLTREGSDKDSRIAEIQKQAREAADKARLEIDRLTLEGGTKDLRIADLEREALTAAEQQRLAKLEIDRLKLEGSGKDLRIADLERDGKGKDDRIRELEEIVRRLEEELKTARLDWAEKERLHGVAIGDKDARIEEIAQKYRGLNLEKQDLQARFDQLLDDSDRNERALKARIAELEKGIPSLIAKLKQTQLELEEAQARLEAGTRNFDEMKQRWIKTKKALDEVTGIKAAFEAESALHAKAEQAWEKEKIRLQRAIEKATEEHRLTGVENTDLRKELDSTLERLRAQTTENRRQTQAYEKQKGDLDSIIASLSADLDLEKDHVRRIQEMQRETTRRVGELEGLQKDLERDLKLATEERDDLRSAYDQLGPELLRQQEEFGHEVDRIQLAADERYRDLLEEMQRLDRRAKGLEKELELLRTHRSVSAAPPVDFANPNRPPVDLATPAAAVNQGIAAARQLEEIVREISAEPILLSRLDQSLIDGYHLNRQLSQIEEMGFDKATGELRVTITDPLSRELSLPRTFSLKPGTNGASLGDGFILPKDQSRQKVEANRICKMMLIKRLQMIRGELMGSTKGAEESKTTPWRTWGEVFKNFTAFCNEMNRNLPTLREHIVNYKRDFARLRMQGIDEALLRRCVEARKIPKEIQDPQRSEIAGLIRLYQTMAKSCEEIFLYSLPRKIPLHHAWKILMLTNHGLPERAYESGALKPAEEAVVGPLQELIPHFYHHFSNMLQNIQIEQGRIVE
ncbi:MAG: hypothetical protein JSR93_04645, partial [Verrucomicrobia bacterium]|nr:hypothetical protein [Verrucomicrobiota bacterium]